MDAKLSNGEPRVLISRSALLHNIRVIKRHINPGVRICAVLKADAYGHSASIVADALTNFSAGEIEAPAVDALAVATLDEAAALPPGPVPVIVLRPVENVYLGRERQRIEAAITAGWILTLCSVEAAGDLSRIAQNIGRRAWVQVMIDTGMSREGAPLESAGAIFEAIGRYPALRLYGMGTHFANSDSPGDPFCAQQLQMFSGAIGPYAARNSNLIRHAANSGAIFFCPTSHFDMIRPGLALYGIDPTCRPSVDRPLRPVLKWTAPLLMVREVAAGQSIGYGQSFVASHDMRIGLVPVGYADGYCRLLSNRGVVRVLNQSAKVVGRVSMDYITIDLTQIPAQAGDTVTLLDNDPLSPASVYEIARIAQTIPYEIFCRIGPRATRLGIEPIDVESTESPQQANR